MRGILTFFLLTLLSVVCVLASEPPEQYRPLPPLRVQDELEKVWVKKRYEFVPTVLKKYGYDAWIITQREYAEDTVFRSLHSSTTTFSARRRTLFLFHTNPDVPSPLLLIDNQQTLWDTLLATLDKVDPKKIAVNIDDDMAFSDGLHTGEGQLLLQKLGPKWAKRVSSERAIGVEVVAARVGGEEQLSMYRLMTENVWRMIEEGFSNEVITVGETTPTDVEWWFRSRMQTLNVTTWFPPSVTFFRSPSEPSTDDHPQAREGDLLHVDIGITAMNMNTDTQHLGYILRSNETKVPAGLVQGLHDANRLQDFTRKRMVPGLTGDEVFEAVIEDMKDAGLKGLIYSHPIGDYGHSAGAIIGMANIQGSVPGGGQNKVLENYWTSVELSGDTYVPEWGIRQLFPLEEDVYWSPKTRTFEWVYGQQTEYHLVKPKKRESSSPSLFTRIGTSLGWNVVRWV
nr:uncharacterized protein CI109_007271 [Kwoniella shandongensis]KAA5524395.1 hypothetical protein CI109_007271 [Kwoniella shandongensis]